MSRKLEIGSGNRPTKGYEHLDINPKCPHLEYVTEMNDIPVPANTFEEIIAIHVIEHISWRKVIPTLKEWVRVLIPEGKIRIATPNLRFITEAYLESRNNKPETFLKDYEIMTKREKDKLQLEGKVNSTLWANFKLFSSSCKFDQHFACYDAETLSALLKLAGCRETEIIKDEESLVLEGTK